LASRVLASSRRSVLDQRPADRAPLCLEEGIGHAAADDEGVDLVEQVLDHRDLVADLGAAEHGDERVVGIGEGLAKVEQFLLEQQAGHGWLQQPGDPLLWRRGRGGRCQRRR